MKSTTKAATAKPDAVETVTLERHDLGYDEMDRTIHFNKEDSKSNQNNSEQYKTW